MEAKLAYLVQGSAPEPYTVTFKLEPFSISCTCQAGFAGMPCKHRIAILSGNDPGIIEGDTSFLPKIAEMTNCTNLFELLDSYDEAKKEKQKAVKRTDYAFKDYKAQRIAFALNEDMSVDIVKAAEQDLEDCINQEILENAKTNELLSALTDVFIRPDYQPKISGKDLAEMAI